MSSSRITYLAPGRRLRLRYPAKPHITKHTIIRTCTGWRRGHPFYQDDRSKRHTSPPSQNKQQQPAEQQQQPSKDESPLPYEPSRREKLWQERMDRIRRMVEHDPYEALFGYSNRLLRGMRRGDWPMDASGPWWRREVGFTVRNPFSQPREKVESEVKIDRSEGNSAEVRTTPPAQSQSELAKEAGTEMVYDPIRGRMVERSKQNVVEDLAQQYKDHGYDVEVHRHDSPGRTSTTMTASKITTSEGVVIPVKPYRPAPEQMESKPRSPPTFTMLKEDLPQEPTQPKQEPEPISAARAEYERYKEKRLREAEKSAKWLESEGFRDSKLDGTRGTLEKSFDDVHSDKQALAEDKLVDKRPWAQQRSPGTTISPSFTTGDSTFASWREKAKIPAYDEAKADREIHEYTMRVAGGNLKNMQLFKERQATERHEQNSQLPLVHPAEDVQADKDIRDYATRVASGNLKTKRFAEQQKMKQETDERLAEMHGQRNKDPEPYEPLLHPSPNAQARRDIQDYASSVVSGNFQAQNFDAKQKVKQAADEKLWAERRKQFEIFNAETARLAEEQKRAHQARKEFISVKAEIADAKANLGLIAGQARRETSGSLQTSLERHQDKSVAASEPLKTTLQRLNKTTSEVVLKPDQSLLADTEQVRTHDPVGYNHERESRHMRRLASAKKPFRVPSLAEVFGYNKKPATEEPQITEQHEIDPSAKWLLGEIETQKELYNKFEASRKEPEVSKEAEYTTLWANNSSKDAITKQVAKEIELKKQDAELVREIRHIYEDKYGAITTSHAQPVEPEVGVVPGEVETMPEPVATPGNEVAEHVVEEPAPSVSEPPTSTLPAEKEPASTLSIPTPSKTAKYTILAYDSKSKNMTTATFESVPSESEKSIPATIALRHLAYANRFLPKLIELQHRGFTPVHAERNLLILRQDASKSTPVVENAEEDPIQSERYIDLNESTNSSTEGKVGEAKRVEPVFSGRVMDHASRERAWRKWKEAQKQERMRRRRRAGRAVRFVASGVVLSAGIVYLAGVGSELRNNRGRAKVVISYEDPSQ